MIEKYYAHLAARKLLLRNLRERGKNELLVSSLKPRGCVKHIFDLLWESSPNYPMIEKYYAHLAARKILLRNLRERGKNVLLVSLLKPRGCVKHIFVLCYIKTLHEYLKETK